MTRAVSSSLGYCELTFIDRSQMDISKAIDQHKTYRNLLSGLGVELIELTSADDMPDAVFIEDTAVVLDEIAVLTRPGVESRRDEIQAVRECLRNFRPVYNIEEPATIEGGDILRIGKKLFAGLTGRTNLHGIRQLQLITADYGYQVIPVPVKGCLHLKTACTFIGNNTVLINPNWINPDIFSGFELIETDPSEAWAANTLKIGNSLLIPAGNPKTGEILESRGFNPVEIEISELQKAEAGLTCLSLVFESEAGRKEER